MFEAIHGSAPRMVEEGRAKYADPSSIIRAAGMLLDHIGYDTEAQKLQMALDICNDYEQKLIPTGRDTGATGSEFAEYLMETLTDDNLAKRWKQFSEK
jgi:isocitrate dehydrogenase (NAD+)